MVISMVFQLFSDEVVSKFTSLFESIDAFGDFEVYPPIIGKLSEIILINIFLRYNGELDSYIFWVVKWHAKVKVGDVKAGKAGIWCRKDAVEEKFDCFK